MLQSHGMHVCSKLVLPRIPSLPLLAMGSSVPSYVKWSSQTINDYSMVSLYSECLNKDPIHVSIGYCDVAFKIYMVAQTTQFGYHKHNFQLYLGLLFHTTHRYTHESVAVASHMYEDVLYSTDINILET